MMLSAWLVHCSRLTALDSLQQPLFMPDPLWFFNEFDDYSLNSYSSSSSSSSSSSNSYNSNSYNSNSSGKDDESLLISFLQQAAGEGGCPRLLKWISDCAQRLRSYKVGKRLHIW
jgi:hypothetical protein